MKSSKIKMFLLAIAGTFFIIIDQSKAQVIPKYIDWIKTFGTNLDDVVSPNMCIDSDSNIYLLYARGNFGGPPNEFYYDSEFVDSEVFATSFLLSISKNGDLLWTKRIEGDFFGYHLMMDTNEDIIIIGKFLNTLNIIGDTTIQNDSDNFVDCILKLNKNRDLIFAYSLMDDNNDKASFRCDIIDARLDENGIYGIVEFKGNINLGDQTFYADSITAALFHLTTDNTLQNFKIFPRQRGRKPYFTKIELFKGNVVVSSDVISDYSMDGTLLKCDSMRILRLEDIPGDSVYLSTNYLLFFDKASFTLNKAYNFKSISTTTVDFYSNDEKLYISFLGLTDTIKFDSFNVIGWPLNKQRGANQPRGYNSIVGFDDNFEPFVAKSFYYSESYTISGLVSIKPGSISIYGRSPDTLKLDHIEIIPKLSGSVGIIYNLDGLTLNPLDYFSIGADKKSTSSLIIGVKEINNDCLVLASFHNNTLFYSDTLNSIGKNDLLVSRLTDKSTGIFLQRSSSPIEIYPNPSNDHIYINIKETRINESFSVKIIDLMGRILFDNKLRYEGLPLELDISSLETGLYIVKLYSNEKEYSTRLNVVR